MDVVEDVVIVGAGFAGLTTALGLHRLGFRSIVLEASDSLRVTGFAFSAWSNAWRALDVIGIGDSLREHHNRLHGLFATSMITGLPTTEISFDVKGKNGDHEVRYVQRRALVEALQNELPSGTVRYSSKLVSIEESGHLKLLHLADGSTLRTKVLIGCDGVNSAVAKWLGFKEPSFVGRTAMRGSKHFSRSHGFEPNFLQFFGEGVRAGFIPYDDKTMYWFFAAPSSSKDKEMEGDPAKVKRFVLDHLGKVPAELREIVESTGLETIISSRLRYRNPWELLWGSISKDNVCVAGDALHPMTPDLGQGGCAAIEDGIVLARCVAEALSKKPSKETQDIDEEEEMERIKMGLQKYARERRWRCFDLVFTAYMVGVVQQTEWKMTTFLRDKLSAVLAGVLLKKADYDCGKLSIS